MNFKKVYNFIQKEFSNFSFEVKSETKDRLELTADIVAENYFDDGVLVRVIVHSDGTVHVFMTFDKLDETLENLSLINQFNDNNSFLSGYISQKDGGKYFELHGYTLSVTNEKEIASCVSFLITKVLSENVLEYLQPITRLTY